MNSMPAVCDNCGVIFHSGMAFENAFNITLIGNKSGPCPKCQGWGHIPDGIYNFTENAIKLIRGSERTRSELLRLQDLLKNAKEQGYSPEQTKTTLTNELSQFHTLADILPKTRADLYAFMAIVLTIVQLMLAAGSHTDKQQSIEVNQVVNICMNQQSNKVLPFKN